MVLKVETLQRRLAEIHKRAIDVYTKHKILPEYNQICTLSIERVDWGNGFVYEGERPHIKIATEKDTIFDEQEHLPELELAEIEFQTLVETAKFVHNRVNPESYRLFVRAKQKPPQQESSLDRRVKGLGDFTHHHCAWLTASRSVDNYNNFWVLTQRAGVRKNGAHELAYQSAVEWTPTGDWSKVVQMLMTDLTKLDRK